MKRWLQVAATSLLIAWSIAHATTMDTLTLRCPWTAATLGTPADGTVRCCSDCTQTDPCAGSGNGAVAMRINGAWQCGAGTEGGGGSGDITDVGDCSTGACFSSGTENQFFGFGASGAASMRAIPAAAIPNLDASKITTGTLALARGGTNQTSWTGSRCVQVNSGGTALESAAAACGSGTSKYYKEWTANQAVQSGSGTFAPRDTRNGHLILLFADGFDTTTYFHGRLNGYTGGGLDVTFSIMCDAATSGTARVITSFESMTDDADDSDSDSFGTTVETACACPNVAGERKYCTAIHADGAPIDSLSDGEDYRIKLVRDGDGTTGTDDLTDEMQLVIISVEEP